MCYYFFVWLFIISEKYGELITKVFFFQQGTGSWNNYYRGYVNSSEKVITW
jgi:hypothetical protein